MFSFDESFNRTLLNHFCFYLGGSVRCPKSCKPCWEIVVEAGWNRCEGMFDGVCEKGMEFRSEYNRRRQVFKALQKAERRGAMEDLLCQRLDEVKADQDFLADG